MAFDSVGGGALDCLFKPVSPQPPPSGGRPGSDDGEDRGRGKLGRSLTVPDRRRSSG
jgi:hypothetical protein